MAFFGKTLFVRQRSIRNFRAKFGKHFGENLGNFVSDFAPYLGNFVQQKYDVKIVQHSTGREGHNANNGIFRIREESALQAGPKPTSSIMTRPTS